MTTGQELRAQVQQWLTNWFLSRSKTGKPTDVPLDLDYFEAGWLTSMEVVELVTAIEETFGTQFSERDLQDPRFVTIAGLTELIVACSTGTSESR